ncbi:hypothetical protein OAI93_01495 [bacterium]|nr:hypothetical protein [bacterium]
MRYLLIILTFNIILTFELITIPEMAFPLSINNDASIVVGTNFASQAVIWTELEGVNIIGDGEFWGISDDGKIAGSLFNIEGKEEAVIWDNGTITFLGNIPNGNSCDSFYSSGLDISSDGSTVVGMGWKNCSVEAFYWNNQNNDIVSLGSFNGNNTKAQAVNANGAIIGGWAESNSGTRQSCIWDINGNTTLIGSLSPWSNAGEVTAFTEDGSKIVGFGASTGGNDTEAYLAIENSNIISGYNMIGLGIPSNFATFNQSWAFDISENNVVVGQYLYSGTNNWRACIWNEDLGTMMDFKQYLELLGVSPIPSLTFLKAHSISNDGKIIAGTAQESNGNWTGFIIDLEDELNNQMMGDLNNDEIINIQDIIIMIDFILENEYIFYGDLNEDEILNIQDIILMLDIILTD